MELVIDIDEDLYKSIIGHRCKTRFQQRCDYENLKNAIEDGIPIPKGHGKLIDRRELKKDVYTTTEWNGDVHRIIYEASIDDASTIIEAEGSDDYYKGAQEEY